MSKLEELMTEIRDTKIETTRDRYIRMGIIHEHLDESPHDISIYKYFDQHRILAKAICIDNRWEPSYNGFVTRTNFKYDEEAKEITFDTHKITKHGNSYFHDGSNEAIERLTTHKGDFEVLAGLDEIIARYYHMYQDKVDAGVEKGMQFIGIMHPNLFEIRLDFAKNHNEMFFMYFGNIGIELLVRWLNKLNEPFNIETLVEEFKNDVDKAQENLELSEDPEYLNSKRMHINFTRVLLGVINRYSPRGKELSSTYRRLYGKSNTTKFDI